MTEPKFTDEDLKQLKEHLELGGYPDERTSFDVNALLARLSAAEAVCEASRIHGGPCSDPGALPNQCNLCEALEAWLASKGEGGR